MRKQPDQPLAVDEESVMDLALESGTNVMSRTQLDLILNQASILANFEQMIPPGARIVAGTGPEWTKLQQRIKARYKTPQAIWDMYDRVRFVRNTVIAYAYLDEYIVGDVEVQKAYTIMDDMDQSMTHVAAVTMDKDSIRKLIDPMSSMWKSKNSIGVNIVSIATERMISIKPVRNGDRVVSLEATLTALVPNV